MKAQIEIAGEMARIDSALEWIDAILSAGAGPCLLPADGAGTLQVVVEGTFGPFDVGGWLIAGRGCWVHDAEVVVADIGGSGFDLHATLSDSPVFRYRWRPEPVRWLAAHGLPARFRLLTRAVLLQYPALWAAGLRGRFPLHAPACTAGDATPLLAGAGGVGKSTLIERALLEGGEAVSDNLSVGDGVAVWGVTEPIRVEKGPGQKTTRGRREATLARRAPVLEPDRVLVIRRGQASTARVEPCDPAVAARALVTGTYMAGELRRYWQFAAVLATGGAGPVVPAVQEVAERFARRLPCAVLTLPRRPGTNLAEVLVERQAIA